MREALIICPKHGNDGADLLPVRAHVAKRLMRAFGGCTVREAAGMWEGPDGADYCEPVWELVAACEPGPDAEATLRDCAADVARLGNQLAVYVRFPSGDVEIINTAAARYLAA
jgi:hypothetical protein